MSRNWVSPCSTTFVSGTTLSVDALRVYCSLSTYQGRYYAPYDLPPNKPSISISDTAHEFLADFTILHKHVMHESPQQGSYSDRLEPPHLAPATAAHLKSLRTHVLAIPDLSQTVTEPYMLSAVFIQLQPHHSLFGGAGGLH